jgi:hypothetical protein
MDNMNELVISISRADNGWVLTGNNHVMVAKTGIYELEDAFRKIVEGWQEVEEVTNE